MLNRRSITRCGFIVVLLGAATGCGDDEPAATARFESPTDGARVAGALEVAMAADGVDIEPAGEVRAGAGHFHVIADDGCTALGTLSESRRRGRRPWPGREISQRSRLPFGWWT